MKTKPRCSALYAARIHADPPPSLSLSLSLSLSPLSLSFCRPLGLSKMIPYLYATFIIISDIGRLYFIRIRYRKCLKRIKVESANSRSGFVRARAHASTKPYPYKRA